MNRVKINRNNSQLADFHQDGGAEDPKQLFQRIFDEKSEPSISFITIVRTIFRVPKVSF